MQAAFVDIGLEKAAFLYVDDVYVHSEVFEEEGASRFPKATDLNQVAADTAAATRLKASPGAKTGPKCLRTCRIPIRIWSPKATPRMAAGRHRSAWDFRLNAVDVAARIKSKAKWVLNQHLILNRLPGRLHQ